jgi:hypothetical protein
VTGVQTCALPISGFSGKSLGVAASSVTQSSTKEA